MGGDISRISPEFVETMRKAAEEAARTGVWPKSQDQSEPADEHEEWRRMNLGTD